MGRAAPTPGAGLAAAAAVDRTFRSEGGVILASLIRVVRDFQVAEDALSEAVESALVRWNVDGIPANPGAWLTRAARNKAIDRLRRGRTRGDKAPILAELARLQADEHRARTAPDARVIAGQEVQDDRLRLIFTCCHPALAPEARVALTLSTLGGLTADEIARAFLVKRTTLQQRLVRAKQKIKQAGIPYRVPGPAELPERLGGVLAVLYLVFNEGYASGGAHLVRADLCVEAIRLVRLVDRLLPGEPEVLGLLALMLLQDSRRAARLDSAGELILLEDQDRSRWDAESIVEGTELVERALRLGRVGPYQVQAAIAAVHAGAATAADTDWAQIAGLYALLHGMTGSPVVALNRAVAVAEAGSVQDALAMVDALVAEGSLDGYHLLHVARADFLRRLDRTTEAAASYEAALALAVNPAERRLLQRRLAELRTA